MPRHNSTGRARSWSVCALAALTAVAVSGVAVGDAGPSGAVPRIVTADQRSADSTGGDRTQRWQLDPAVRESLRQALTRVRAHDPLPERAPASEPRNRGESPAKVAVEYAANGIPDVALQAYRNAAGNIDAELPACHLDWALLAGIGRIESNHGRFGGSPYSPAPNGDAIPTILGPVLDGGNATARITDTDGGRYDHDRTFDRAVGPMQFLPGTWAVVGADGNGDGTADPNNIFDAALGAAEYLCAGDRDLQRPADLHAAVFSYNHSQAYVAEVLGLTRLYREGRTPTVPTVEAPIGWAAAQQAAEAPTPDREAKHPKRDGTPRGPAAGHDDPGGTPGPQPSPYPSPSSPSQSPTPGSPSQSPTAGSPSPTDPGSSPPTSPSSPPPSSEPTTGPTGPTAPDAPQKPAIEGDDPAIATTVTPTFTASVEGSTEPLSYVFQIWPEDPDADGADQLAGRSVDTEAGKAAEWALGDKDLLKDGESYSLRVLAKNAAGGAGHWSEWLQFTVTVPPDPTPTPTPTPTTTPTGSSEPGTDPTDPASSSPSSARESTEPSSTAGADTSD